MIAQFSLNLLLKGMQCFKATPSIMPGKRVQDRGSPAGQDGRHTLHNPSEQTKKKTLTPQPEMNKK